MKKFLLLTAVVVTLFACNNDDAEGKDMDSDTTLATGVNEFGENDKEERNRQVALASVQGFNSRNVDVILKDADVALVDYGDGSMPPANNRDTVRKWLQDWLNAVPDYKGENFMAAAEGDQVMVYAEWSGTWKNDLMGMKATGKTFKIKDVDIFKFNEAGKIIEHRSVQSSAGLAQQLGMPMPEQTKN